MRKSWITSVAMPLGLLVLLAACQPSPYGQRSGYAQPVRYASTYDPCARSYGCGPAPARQSFASSGRLCPPGHRLIRLPYSTFSRPARDCVPVFRSKPYRYASAPPPAAVRYRSYAPAPCNCVRTYREVRSRPIQRHNCCR